jgi:hypothetical protein
MRSAWLPGQVAPALQQQELRCPRCSGTTCTRDMTLLKLHNIRSICCSFTPLLCPVRSLKQASLVRPVAASRTRQQVATQALFGFGAKKEDAGAAPKVSARGLLLPCALQRGQCMHTHGPVRTDVHTCKHTCALANQNLLLALWGWLRPNITLLSYPLPPGNPYIQASRYVRGNPCSHTRKHAQRTITALHLHPMRLDLRWGLPKGPWLLQVPGGSLVAAGCM